MPAACLHASKEHCRFSSNRCRICFRCSLLRWFLTLRLCKLLRLIRPYVRLQYSPTDAMPRLPTVLHARYQTHMLAIALAEVIDMFKILNSMFCASNLLSKGNTFMDCKYIAGAMVKQLHLGGGCATGSRQTLPSSTSMLLSHLLM